MSGRPMWRAVLLAAWLLAGAWAPPARAQELISPYLEEGTEPFSLFDVLALTRRAAFNDEKLAAARDILEGSRIELAIAQRVLDRTRWRIDLEHPEDDPKHAKPREQALKHAQSTFRSKSEEIEKGFLADMRMLLGSSQEPQWEKYLRDRRLYAFWMTSGVGGIVRIGTVLEHLELSDQERAGIARPLAEHEDEVDKAICDYLAIRRQQLAAQEAADGDLPADQAESYSTRTKATLVRAAESIARAVKTISAELTPEHAIAFAARFDVQRARLLLSATALEQDPEVGEIVRISTLTRDQKLRLRQLIRKADEEIARNYRPVLAAFDARLAGNDYNFDQEAYEKATKAAAPVYAKLRKEMLEVLTSEQRRAMDEGAEPPLRPFESRWRDQIDRRDDFQLSR